MSTRVIFFDYSTIGKFFLISKFVREVRDLHDGPLLTLTGKYGSMHFILKSFAN